MHDKFQPSSCIGIGGGGGGDRQTDGRTDGCQAFLSSSHTKFLNSPSLHSWGMIMLCSMSSSIRCDNQQKKTRIRYLKMSMVTTDYHYTERGCLGCFFEIQAENCWHARGLNFEPAGSWFLARCLWPLQSFIEHSSLCQLLSYIQ